ncbi:MAG: hypothetical protein AAGC44_01800 [Planctomycetota bacterium]
MTKQQTIDLIRQRNRSASPEFLTHFDERNLEAYLKRLSQVAGHRGSGSRWVRQTSSPAVTTRAVA